MLLLIWWEEAWHVHVICKVRSVILVVAIGVTIVLLVRHSETNSMTYFA